jgi:predicted nucleotide-binding protein
LTADEMRARIKRLEVAIEEVAAFDPNAFQGDDSILTGVSGSVDDALADAFGKGTPEYDRYREAATFTYPLRVSHPTPLHEKREALERRRLRSFALLKQAVGALSRQLDELPVAAAPSAPEPKEAKQAKQPERPNRIFIVHGHDNEAKQTVARFISQLGLQEVILHEQVSQGRTIIEKLEANSDVGFAVVLLTPDDEGRPRGAGELRQRARQNVIAELGYFVGHLKRDKVCALVKGDVEFPSDFSGVVFVPFEAASNHWKIELAKELKAAGYQLKMEALLGV